MVVTQTNATAVNESQIPVVASTVSVPESRREVPSRRAASIASAKILEQTAAGDVPMEVDESEGRPSSGYPFK